MAYVPNATQTTEPVESRSVESAALEFRTLKNKVVTDSDRIEVLENLIPTIGTADTVTALAVVQLAGTGSQVAFVLPVEAVSPNQVSVAVNGIHQHRNTYTVSGDVLTLSEAPTSGAAIEVTVSSVVTPPAIIFSTVGVQGVINSSAFGNTSLTCSPSLDGTYVTISGTFLDTPANQSAYSGVNIEYPAEFPIVSTDTIIGTGVAAQLDMSFTETYGNAVAVMDGNLMTGDDVMRVQWRTKAAADPACLAVKVYFTATYKIA